MIRKFSPNRLWKIQNLHFLYKHSFTITIANVQLQQVNKNVQF